MKRDYSGADRWEQAQEDKTQYASYEASSGREAGDATALESLVSSEDFSDLLSKAEYVQSVHGYDRDKLEEYVATKQKIADLKEQLETEQSQLESMQTEYETEESNLTTLIDSKQAEVADLDSQIQEAAEKAAKEEEERQKKAEEERQKQLQAASQNSTTTNSNSGSSNSSSSSNSNKGNSSSNSNSSSNKGNSSSSSSSSSGSYVSGSTVSRAYSALENRMYGERRTEFFRLFRTCKFLFDRKIFIHSSVISVGLRHVVEHVLYRWRSDDSCTTHGRCSENICSTI